MYLRLIKLSPCSTARLIAIAALLFCTPSQAVTVVFGSYTDDILAADTARRTSELLGVETRLSEAIVKGEKYLRILGPAAMSTAEARVLAERAEEQGFQGAWLMPDPVPAPVAKLPSVPVETLTDTAAPAPEPLEDELAPAPAAVVALPAGAGPGSAPDRLLLTTSELESGASIVVLQFDEDEIEFTLDGELNEPVWAQLPGYDEMRVLEPDTLEEPRHRTVMRYFYTEKALYISMYAEQPPDTLIERLSSRDDYFLRDGLSLTLDTSGAGIYGYWFSVNLGDTLSDGKVAPERQYSSEWDGPWDGRTARHAEGWSAEMVLPWSMMAMPNTEGERNIGLYVSRLVGYLDEKFGFPALPPTGARFMSALQPMALEAVTPQRQLDLYPYISGTHDVNADESEGNVGIDVFWRPSTNLQMSATLNPDFGAVESDDVVINLTSLETFFPEKRLFFLEGNEIFATTPRSRPQITGSRTTGSRRTTQLFTPEPTQVVNTRRIGGAPDVQVPPGVIVPGFELSQPTDLIGAIKATGQVGRVRYGVMGASEDDMELRGFDLDGNEVLVDSVGRDFGVARLFYEDVGQSRKSVGYIGTYTKNQSYDAVVHGLDGHYLSGNGKLQLDAQLLASDVDTAQGYGALVDVNYTQRRGLVHTLRLDAQDDKLDINDLGFLRRNDNYGGNYSLSFSKSQGLETLRLFNSSVSASYWENGDGLATRTGAFWRNTFTFKNNFQLRTELDYFPERWDDLESEGNGAYRLDDRWIADLAFGTDASKILSFSGRLGTKQEELSGWTYVTSLGVTYKPNHRFSLDLDLNYQDRDGWLLYTGVPDHPTRNRDFTTYGAQDFQPRLGVDLFLSARQQFRLSLQWAAIKAEEQERWVLPEDGDGNLVPVIPDEDAPSRDFVINRMTVQLRYRWQIAPLSDLFVVYTRGSNIPGSMIDDDFGELFQDALQNPVVDFLVVKLRYRFGL